MSKPSQIYSMSALTSLNNVCVRLGKSDILHDINLTIQSGDFWSLIGPNGAGKSTLLGLFNGMTSYYSGNIEYEGKLLTKHNIHSLRLKIAHVFQAADIDYKMPLSVFESVLGGTYGRLGLIRKPGKREKEIAMQSLETVGLSDLANRPLGQLSGGQQQRAALARALAQEPELILLDEPTAALDWQSQRDILNSIAVMRRDHNLTVIMVTHDLNAVFHLAQKVAMLREGRLIWHGNANDAMNAELLTQLYNVPICIADYKGRKAALF